MTDATIEDAIGFAMIGDKRRLRELVSREARLLGSHRLLLEVARRKPEVLELLLTLGADSELVDPSWATSLLSAAAAAPNCASMNVLLAAAALVDGPATLPNSPLLYAAKNGRLDSARILVEHGADLDRDSLGYPHTPLNVAEELAPLIGKGQAEVAEYLRSVGATKPWDYHRHEDFWDDVLGELTILLVEGTLGLTHAHPVGESRTPFATIHIRRARHGWKKNFQTLYSAGLTHQGGKHEIGLCLTSKWPLHKRALEEERFRRPVDFLLAVSDRVLQGAVVRHGDVLDRDHELVRGLEWPGDFQQWLVVDHESFKQKRAELADPDVPLVLLLVPHLAKKPLKAGPDAVATADLKAKAKWERPAASGGKHNLVVPLCYDAPWLKGKWF
jgi:hypothetical protein